MPFTAEEIEAAAEAAWRCYAAKGEHVARNRVDEVLGFEAPNWLDEVMAKKGIHRQRASKDEVRGALNEVLNQQTTRLLRDVEEMATLAGKLGFKVVAADLDSSAKALRNKTPDDSFFKHRYDPRP